jgi:hypothetical protein
VPDEAILREGREENADLIALQTRGRGGFARLVLGSVTGRSQRADGRCWSATASRRKRACRRDDYFFLSMYRPSAFTMAFLSSSGLIFPLTL